ncbi:MAG: beta-ketoacyl-[acyl-carrier-protein] synthase family protein, partial [Opitutaceae bacterium]|nr:beta-ketoacyl-[acyl-carrier-protein] synthase family protein [Verrucomicrobiales bacterium]
MMNNEPQRRVVITGIGVIAPNGNDLETFWESLCAGRSGAARVTRFNVADLPVKCAAEVKNFNIDDYLKGSKAGRYDLTIQFGVAAASNAIKDSRLDFDSLDPDRLGVVEGTTISGAESIIKAHTSFLEKKNFRSVHPYNVVAGYCGEGSSTIALHLGLRGMAVTYCSGCASGNDAIGYGMSMVQQDEVDVMVAGGAEEIVEMLHVGFCRLKAMTEIDCDPTEAMRPFDRSRDGFVLGEGAAFVVLEELSHALSRGARIYAEVVGHGRSNEAFHATDPHPSGTGFVRAMEKALRKARMHPSEIDYINAHGSATALNDPIETQAIKRIFGEHVRGVAVSATKPVTGHLMGASGAVETVVCALALHHQEIPPTINLRNPDSDCDLDYVR